MGCIFKSSPPPLWMEEIMTDHKMAEVHVCPWMILGKPGTLKVDFYVELISGFHMTSCNRMF